MVFGSPDRDDSPEKGTLRDCVTWPIWKEWLALLCVLAIPHVLIFGPALIGKTYLLPLDLLALDRFYLPKTAEYSSVIPHSRHATDLILEYPAERKFIADEYAAGRIPLWSPYNYLGAPIVDSTKYSPFELPLVLFRSPVMLAWQQLCLGLWAGIGCYVFLRQVIAVGPLPALIGAACYPWTGYFVLWQGFQLAHAVTFLPWMLFATYHTAIRPAGWGGPSLAVLTMLTVLSRIESAGQVLLVCGFFAIAIWLNAYWQRWLSREFWVSVLTTCLAWGLGLAACCVLILPFVDYLKTGIRMQDRLRGVEERPPGGWSMIPLVFVPDAYGSAKHTEIQIMKGNQFESTASAYAGLVLALFLVPLSWSSRRHRHSVVCFCVIGILGISWQLNIPGIVQVLRLPLINILPHNRFVFATAFSLIVLAAIGGEALISRDLKFRVGFLVPIAIGTGLAGWCLYRWRYLPGQLQSMIASGELRLNSNIDVVDALRSCAISHARGFGLAAIAVSSWLLVRCSREVRTRGLCLVGIIALAELLCFASKENRQSDPRLYYPDIPALAAIGNHPPGRVMGIGCLPPLLNVWYGLHDVRGYDAVDPKGVVDLFGIATDARVKSPSYARTQWAVPKIFENAEHQKRMSPIWDMLNVRYFITRSVPPGGFPVIIHIDDYWVFENPRALPRTFVPKSVARLSSQADLLRQLGKSEFDPSAVAFTTEDIIEEIPDHVAGSAKITVENPQSIEIQAEMDTPGMVVLADLWDKGWVAEVDGQPTQLRCVNHCLRAIVLAPGIHQIVMRYEPRSYYQGWRISLCAMGAMTIWLVVLSIANVIKPRQRTRSAIACK
ncbi:MAG: hypothetical protein JWM11_6826 [Planctomycetaceae bacterium]|nr:hypothetical protein [Planctomycetaceae bacterium]